MADRAILTALIDQAARELNVAARQLASQTGQDRHARAQLAMLRDYRADYMRRLEQAGQRGMTGMNYANFTLFIATLDGAIVQQNNTLAQLQNNMAACRQQWHGRRRRLKALEILAARETLDRAKRQNRQEQRACDECASALHYRRLQQPYLQARP